MIHQEAFFLTLAVRECLSVLLSENGEHRLAALVITYQNKYITLRLKLRPFPGPSEICLSVLFLIFILFFYTLDLVQGRREIAAELTNASYFGAHQSRRVEPWTFWSYPA